MLVFASLVPSPAPAQASDPAVHGTVGLVKVPFEVRNDSADTIACGATLAHWNSLELGEAAPGDSVAAALWADPLNGETFLLNGSQARMSVESLWCGFAGRSWATRSMVELDRRAGESPAPINMVCQSDGGRLVCR